jgi:hypothetical protein
VSWTDIADGQMRNDKGIWQSAGTKAKGQVDRSSDHSCKKTARERRVDRMCGRQEYLGEIN